MNDRINELFGQALDQAVPETWTTLTPAQLSKLKEKFAELIVRECMAMCKTAVGNADYNTGRLHCLNNIKEHFGVES
jgi:hypothetical protein